MVKIALVPPVVALRVIGFPDVPAAVNTFVTVVVVALVSLTVAPAAMVML